MNLTYKQGEWAYQEHNQAVLAGSTQWVHCAENNRERILQQQGKMTLGCRVLGGPVILGSRGGANVQEFQTFYQENLGLIYRYVYSKVGNREEAEDLTSQIFMKAVRGVDTERGAQSMQKWLFQVARTTIADYWRAHYRISTSSLDQLLEIGWEGPADEGPTAISSTPTERVHHILQALPEHYREVLTCRFLLNLSIRDTANRMCLTEANVKVLQFRALKRAADLELVVSGIR